MRILAGEARAFIRDQPAAFLAYALYQPGLDLSAVMAQLDAALAVAETKRSDGPHQAVLVTDEKLPKSSHEWFQLIRLALDQHWTMLGEFAVVNFNGQLLHHECPLRMKFEENGEWLPAGHFLPIAKRLHLTRDLDLAAVANGLNKLRANPLLVGLAINLSAMSIEDPQFRKSLMMQLYRYAAETKRLWVEVPEAGALRHIDQFRSFCRELKRVHCKVGLEHFGRQFSQIGQLHDIGLDYIKVDTSFIRGVDSNAGNQTFLKGVCSIAHSIGLTVIAEGVSSQAEFDTLEKLGFDGATGPSVKLPDGSSPAK